MSRRTKRSQASPSQKNNTLTQQTLEESFQEINLDITEQVNDLVRYIVNRAGSHLTIKQNDIKKNVFTRAGPKYQEIIDKTTKILKQVYGYNMIVSNQSTNSREYVISNALPYIKDPTADQVEEYPQDAHKVILLLILSHIFMSNGVVSEVSLYTFLKSLNIDAERRHEMFGNVKDYIHHDLQKKKYLKIEMDQISKKISFSWGVRAEAEISKHQLLKFVCKIYNDRLPNTWVNQFKAAEEQGFENHRESAE